jgi:hypothetical protein
MPASRSIAATVLFPEPMFPVNPNIRIGRIISAPAGGGTEGMEGPGVLR